MHCSLARLTHVGDPGGSPHGTSASRLASSTAADASALLFALSRWFNELSPSINRAPFSQEEVRASRLARVWTSRAPDGHLTRRDDPSPCHHAAPQMKFIMQQIIENGTAWSHISSAMAAAGMPGRTVRAGATPTGSLGASSITVPQGL